MQLFELTNFTGYQENSTSPHYFTHTQGIIAKDIEDNKVLARVLEVLSLLVKYGYYDDPSDVEDVLEPLADIMNGFTDLPFPSPVGEEISGRPQFHTRSAISQSINYCIPVLS